MIDPGGRADYAAGRESRGEVVARRYVATAASVPERRGNGAVGTAMGLYPIVVPTMG
jgi:hypothetical protein